MEDDADSIATMTTATFTSGNESEWEKDITEILTETTTANDQMYVFGKRRLVKAARKWRTPKSQARKGKEQPKAGETNNAQAFTVNGVFMFGRAAQAVKTTKRPLVTVPELPSDNGHGKVKKTLGKYHATGLDSGSSK